MFCGRFIPVKNLPKILEGYAEYCRAVPDALDLIMVGDGPSKNELVELTLKLGVKEKVFFNGFVQYEQLPQYYGLADLFILGSYMEQWGLVVNEAMASGLPVLVSNKCGCVNDLVRNNENGFVFNPNNPEELAICLKEITAHPLKLKNMGKDSLKIIKDWDITKFSLSFCECVDLANNKFTNRPMFLFKLFIRLLSRRFFGAANKI
jgi:glycosyltransferase involved in cell wall biosynthesis